MKEDRRGGLLRFTRKTSLNYGYVPRQEEGKNFVAIGFAAAGPHFQPWMILPPSVVPTRAVVALIIGVNSIELVAAVSCERLAWFPTTKIFPLASAAIEVTNLLA